jgi:hypothetical protein
MWKLSLIFTSAVKCVGVGKDKIKYKTRKSNSTWLDLLHAEVWLMGRLLLLLLCIKHCRCCCCSAESTVVVVVAAADNVTTLIFTLTAVAAAKAAAAEFMKQKNHGGMKEGRKEDVHDHHNYSLQLLLCVLCFISRI